MAESEAIARMAEQLSDDLFGVFKWKSTGPLNVNWDCVNSEKHNGRKTHPSDVVFYYDEPYSTSRSYINIDLKSYAKSSIQTSSISTAITNLIDSVECANSSTDWQSIYTHNGKSFDVHGMLFIYNHDGGYDSNFLELLARCNIDGKNLPSSSRAHVFGPERITYLATVANDIQISKGKIGFTDYDFFYPDLAMKTNRLPEWSSAATVEMLTSPLIIMKHRVKDDNHDHALIIYYERKGESREEFMYLIDYLFHYQEFQNASSITVKLVSPSPNAIAVFEKSKEQYIDDYTSSNKDVALKLNKIKAKTIIKVVPEYSQIEIGMNCE